MAEIAVGMAIMWLVTVFFKKPITVTGLPSILFMLVIVWGLGKIFLTLLGR